MFGCQVLVSFFLYPISSFQIPTTDSTYTHLLSHLSLLQTRPSQKNGKTFPLSVFQSPRLPECRNYSNSVNVRLFAVQSPNSTRIARAVRCSCLITLSTIRLFMKQLRCPHSHHHPHRMPHAACYFPIRNRNVIDHSISCNFFVFSSYYIT